MQRFTEEEKEEEIDCDKASQANQENQKIS